MSWFNQFYVAQPTNLSGVTWYTWLSLSSTPRSILPKTGLVTGWSIHFLLLEPSDSDWVGWRSPWLQAGPRETVRGFDETGGGGEQKPNTTFSDCILPANVKQVGIYTWATSSLILWLDSPYSKSCNLISTQHCHFLAAQDSSMGELVTD